MDSWMWRGKEGTCPKSGHWKESFQNVFFHLCCLGKGKENWAGAGGLIRVWYPAEAWHIVGPQYMLMV